MDQPQLERTATWMRVHPFAVDAVLAALFFLFTTAVVTAGATGGSVLIGLLMSVPLAWRRTAPVKAAAALVGAGLLQIVLVGGSLLPVDAAAPIMVYALAAYAPQWASRTGLAIGLVASGLGALQYHRNFYELQSLVVMAGLIAITVVAAWALGNLRRARIQQLAGLQERTRLLELERDQEMRLAATAERARIARGMHDVAAHSLSGVVAQADGGRYAGQAEPAAATEALEQISATGRQALTDMRSLLGVLREDGAQEFAPQPDVAAIDRLVADVQSSGLDVDLIVEGSPAPMPAGPQLPAYRIVQESLINVLKHAGPGCRAWVRLHWRPDALEIAVLDDGRGAAAAVADPDGPVPPGPGHGLLGMRERAQLHGGRLTAAPRHGGGFGIQAVLPYRAPR